MEPLELLGHIAQLGHAGRLAARPGCAALLSLFYPPGRVQSIVWEDPGAEAWSRIVRSLPARIVIDSAGREWTILHTAEKSYLQVMALHDPEITRSDARAQWSEIVNHVHRVRVAGEDSRLDVWRADGKFKRIYLVVEPVARGFRVCEVRPAHEAAKVPVEGVEVLAARPARPR